ncbi:MAG: hypothetical protein ACK42C_08220 [Aquificaceae bacterium]|jgi:hypothetical protein|uniref:hypothetical protein n=1 Tax=Hydrogenobacter sp. Uz 6-8 TaxID=3384828 RepID=UPI0030B41037
MEIVAKSLRIEVIGEIERCHDGENSKFYCLPVRIHFENGEVKEYMLRAHGEPKTLKDFLENKKGLRDRMERSFGLTKAGKVLYIGYSSQEASDS